MATSPYISLPQLHDYAIPVYASLPVHDRAHVLAQEFEQAYHYLSKLLNLSLDVRLALLSKQDWVRLTSSPYYGAVLYDYPNRTVVGSAEPSSFWQSLVTTLETAALTLFQELQSVYAGPGGAIDLSSSTELWIIHDLGHACHLHHNYWFPRRWLMELFANLCLYTYTVEQTPAHQEQVTTYFSVLDRLPLSLITNQTITDFEAQYIELPLDDYSWFSGHFMRLAQELHGAFGQEALTRLWRLFVLNNIQQASGAEWWEQTHDTDPALSARLVAFERQYTQAN